MSKKIATLAQIAQELHQGKNFNLTRLTSLKSLCADPKAAGQFCFYLAQLTQQKLQDKEKPDYLEEEIELKQAKPYDEAVALLKDLRDLADYQGRLPAFTLRFEQLKSDYQNRPALMARFKIMKG